MLIYLYFILEIISKTNLYTPQTKRKQTDDTAVQAVHKNCSLDTRPLLFFNRLLFKKYRWQRRGVPFMSPRCLTRRKRNIRGIFTTNGEGRSSEGSTEQGKKLMG